MLNVECMTAIQATSLESSEKTRRKSASWWSRVRSGELCSLQNNTPIFFSFPKLRGRSLFTPRFDGRRRVIGAHTCTSRRVNFTSPPIFFCTSSFFQFQLSSFLINGPAVVAYICGDQECAQGLMLPVGAWLCRFHVKLLHIPPKFISFIDLILRGVATISTDCETTVQPTFCSGEATGSPTSNPESRTNSAEHVVASTVRICWGMLCVALPEFCRMY